MRMSSKLSVLILLVALATSPLRAAGPAFVPIAAARQQAQGTVVTVEGVVTVPSGDFRSSSSDEGFAIQDQTGGIWVSLNQDLHLRIGQLVRVRGTLGESEEKLQIAAVPQDVQRLPRQELRVATGQVGTATLGFLITVEGTVTQAVEDDLPYGYKVYIDDGSGPAQIYLNSSTNIDPRSPWFQKGRKIRVTGFGNQYGTAYEVDPRSRRDIRPVR